jgi:phage terminase Nu1 subunit (DNA packaging protein)
MFKGFEVGDGFSNDQWEYLINHRHFEIGLLTPEDRIELAKIIEKIINKLLEIESIKKRFPKLNHNEWQMILIEIISALLEARIEREGKARLDYIEQAKEIVSGLN